MPEQFDEPSTIKSSYNSILDSDVLEYKEIENASSEILVTEEKKWTKRQKLTFFVVAICYFSCSALFAIQSPFFPNEATKKGASKTSIGFIFGTFSLVVLVSSLLVGKLITRLGAKFCYCSGCFISGCCALMFGFTDQGPDGFIFVAMCIAVRAVEGVGCSLSITSGSAIIIDQFPNQVGTIMGTMESFSSLGFFLGPVIGGSLFTIGGFKLPFLVMGGLVLLVFVMSFFLLPQQNDKPTVQKKGLLSIVRIPSVLIVSFVMVIASATFGFTDPTLSLHLKDKFNLSTVLIGVVFLVCACMYCIIAPLCGRLIDKKGWTKSLMIVGLLTCAVSFSLMGPSPLLHIPRLELWITFTAQVLLGIGAPLSEVPVYQDLLNSALNNGFPDTFETYGIVSGVINSCESLGPFLGATVGGYLNDQVGFSWAATYLSGALIFAALLLTVFKIFQDIPKSNKNNLLDIDERQPLLIN